MAHENTQVSEASDAFQGGAEEAMRKGLNDPNFWRRTVAAQAAEFVIESMMAAYNQHGPEGTQPEKGQNS